MLHGRAFSSGGLPPHQKMMSGFIKQGDGAAESEQLCLIIS